jgi:hypothetical protein
MIGVVVGLAFIVVGVPDGDTHTVRDGDTRTVLRLAEIDAPSGRRFARKYLVAIWRRCAGMRRPSRSAPSILTATAARSHTYAATASM